MRLSDDDDIDIMLTGGSMRYNFRQRKSQASYYSNSDNDNGMNDTNNDTNASSISEYNINDENHHFDSDGSFIEKSNYNSDSCDSDNDIHVLHPLLRWNFNEGSRLNRMAESDWIWRRKHCTASSTQGNTLYHL